VAQDPDLNVRKSAFIALSAFPASPEISNTIYQASMDESNAKDAYLPQILFSGLLAHPSYFEQNMASLFPEEKADSLYSLTDRLIKSLVVEQYNLDRRAAIVYPPDISNKEIHIKTELAEGNEPLEGVIVAQGNKTNGYSLFVKNSTLNWVVKQNGKTYKVTASKLPKDLFRVEAKLLQGGEMTLQINDNPIAKTKAPGLFTAQLSPDRIRVGNDMGDENQVGDYEGASWLRGRMGRDSYLSLNDPNFNLQEFLTKAPEKAAATVSRENALVVKIGVIPHEMKYNVETFKVKAGQQVIIDFENRDFMQHNLVLGKIGSLEIIGKAADEMSRDPKGLEKNYIPEIPEIITASKLVDPEGLESIIFTAPTQKGEYPFICTVPGHWRIMNGKMIVE
jgi:azurin